LTLREEYRLRVFEDSMLRRIFGPKKYEVRGGWRILHNEDLHDLYSSPSISRMMKSMRIRSTRYVVRKGAKRNAIGFWWDRQKERDYEENQDVGG
jgi:hypothetical protein